MDKMLRFHDKREAEGILVRASRPVGQTIGEGTGVGMETSRARVDTDSGFCPGVYGRTSRVAPPSSPTP